MTQQITSDYDIIHVDTGPSLNPADRKRQLEFLNRHVADLIEIILRHGKRWIGQKVTLKIGRYKGYDAILKEAILSHSNELIFSVHIIRKDGKGYIDDGYHSSGWSRSFYGVKDFDFK